MQIKIGLFVRQRKRTSTRFFSISAQLSAPTRLSHLPLSPWPHTQLSHLSIRAHRHASHLGPVTACTRFHLTFAQAAIRQRLAGLLLDHVELAQLLADLQPASCQPARALRLKQARHVLSVDALEALSAENAARKRSKTTRSKIWELEGVRIWRGVMTHSPRRSPKLRID